MQQYSYKNSGIEWLGEIPEHWNIQRLFNIGNFVRGNSAFEKNDLLSKGKYVALQYGKTYKVEEVNEEFQFYVNDEFFKSTQTVDFGNVIFVSTSETIEDLGHSVYYNRKDTGLIGGEQILLKPRKNILEGKYLFYASKAFSKQLNKFATGIKVFRFDQYDLKTIYLPLPPLPEQKAIADYLDKACARIDRIIAIKEEQLRKIEGNLRANISQLFSFGLDRSSETKSLDDYKYLGKVPKHWKVTQVKFVFDFLDNLRVPLSSADRGEMVDKIYDYYGASGIIDKVENYIFDEPLILIGEDGANLLTRSKPLAFIAKGKYWVNNHAHVLKPKFGKIEFWTHLLEHLDYSLYVTGAAQPKLSNTNLGKMKIAFPVKHEEQDQILSRIEFLKESTVKLKNNVINQITTLQSYRKSLIHECVTGKKQVYSGEITTEKEASHG